MTKEKGPAYSLMGALINSGGGSLHFDCGHLSFDHRYTCFIIVVWLLISSLKIQMC